MLDIRQNLFLLFWIDMTPNTDYRYVDCEPLLHQDKADQSEAEQYHYLTMQTAHYSS